MRLMSIAVWVIKRLIPTLRSLSRELYMRAIISKVVAVSLVAGAGLMVAACGGETTAVVNNTTTTETVVTENAGVEDTMVGADLGNGTVVETNTTTVETNTTTTNSH